MGGHYDRPIINKPFKRGYIGVMEKKMETTIMGYVGIIGYILLWVVETMEALRGPQNREALGRS